MTTCRYTISVKTGIWKDAGTDAKISLVFISADGADRLYIENLETWPCDHEDPFEGGSLDTFQVQGRCMEDLCLMMLRSDGSGDNPGWYVDYVRIEGDDTAAHVFEFYRWIGPPDHLYAAKNLCGGAATM